MKKLFLLLSIMFCGCIVFAQTQQSAWIDPGPFADASHHWYGIADKGNMINALPGRPRYKPTDVTQIADNILLFQKSNGGWPKNYDMFAILTANQKKKVAADRDVLNTTFDNGTCFSQIRGLAIAYHSSKNEKYREGAIQGLQYIIKAQYANGGWPQSYPLQQNYSREITYNDGAFDGIMRLLQSIRNHDSLYDFVTGTLRSQLIAAYNKGIDCILATQIKDDNELTAWCQQYNEVTLQPAWARAFEPPSICNGESTDIVLFLMSIPNPDKRVIEAVQSAVHWFKQSEIHDTKVETIRADTLVTPYRVSTTDRIVVRDTSAPPIWTRYYELGTHRPLFCNRDGIVVYSLAEVKRERRDGYSWYTYAPQKVLKKYPEWEKKWVKK